MPKRKKYLMIALIAAGILVFSYLLFCISVASFYDEVIYQPTAKVTSNPADIGIPYENITLYSSGIEIKGWFIPGNGTHTVLFFHGTVGNMGGYLDYVREFHKMNLSVFMIDYRGYGESGGSISEGGLYSDSEAAWNYLNETRGIHSDRMIVYGQSLGGALAAHLALDHDPKAFVLDSTFASLKDVIDDYLFVFPVGWLIEEEYSTASDISHAKAPVLVIHSKDDNRIPLRQGKRVYSQAPEPKEMLVVGGPHGRVLHGSESEWRMGFSGFIDENDGSSMEHNASSSVIASSHSDSICLSAVTRGAFFSRARDTWTAS